MSFTWLHSTLLFCLSRSLTFFRYTKHTSALSSYLAYPKLLYSYTVSCDLSVHFSLSLTLLLSFFLSLLFYSTQAPCVFWTQWHANGVGVWEAFHPARRKNERELVSERDSHLLSIRVRTVVPAVWRWERAEWRLPCTVWHLADMLCSFKSQAYLPLWTAGTKRPTHTAAWIPKTFVWIVRPKWIFCDLLSLMI